jgi:kynurenine formamidase
MIDLASALDYHSPFWPEGNSVSPFLATTAAGERDGLFARKLQFTKHFGTCMDAPLHLDPKGQSVEEIPV